MDYKFDTKEKYIGFFEKLAEYCDVVALLSEDDLSPEAIDNMMQHKSEVKWIREFPGYKFRGKVKVQVPFYPLTRKVISVFKEYDSFLKVGYNSETKLGFDMAFYKGDDLVFLVLRHESMSFLRPEHEQYFAETIREYKIEPMYP